jgi:hypothetical protein
MSDQYKQRHLLPLYLSKITPPDSNFLGNAKTEEFSAIPKDAAAILEPEVPRGIRTLAEIAHFVRCLPFREAANTGRDRVWSSPDFTLSMHLASVEEHALLLASMFRACKFEDHSDLQSPEGAVGTTIADRVFVCLGRLRSTGQEHAWVMTLNSTYD